MSSLYGVNYTKSEVNVPSEKLPIGDLGGRVRMSLDSHTFAANVFATTDELFMNRIPKGAKIIDVIVECEDLGTTGILNIGHDGGDNGNETADADAFFAAQDVKAAAIRAKLSSQVAGSFKDFGDDCFLKIVPTENTDAASGKKISVCVLYVIA